MGLGLGAGHAEAKIDSGQYVEQTIIYGAIPSPESNTRVVGNSMFRDYYGVGSPTTFKYSILPTKSGGNASKYGTNPAAQWFDRIEYHKTKNGYVGTIYAYGGIPSGVSYLKKTTRHANQPR